MLKKTREWLSKQPPWKKGGYILLGIYLFLLAAIFFFGIVPAYLYGAEATAKLNAQGYDIVYPGWLFPWLYLNIVPVLFFDLLHIALDTIIGILLTVMISGAFYFGVGSLIGWLVGRVVERWKISSQKVKKKPRAN